VNAARAPAVARSELDELIAGAHRRLKTILFFHHIPPEDAEDLLQEVFLVLVRRWNEEPRTIREPRAWLNGVAHWTCRHHIARRREQRLELMEDGKLIALAGTLEAPQLAADLRREVGQRLARLDPCAAERLWLYVGLGLSRAEVAARVGGRPKSVSKMVSRSLEKLRAAG
jgi:RNA polymerase sigma factor (sigma-70 family)